MSDIGFGLEISDKYTRLCDARLSNKKIQLLSLGYEETIPAFFSNDTEKMIKDQAEVIKRMVTNAKIKKRNVHVVIPDTYSFSQIIEMPKLKEKELLAAIRYQSDEFIPMPIDETSIDLEILREDTANKKLLILIVASPKKIVTQIEKVIEAAGLIPETLENELSVAGRFFSDILPVKTGSTIVINFGYYSSSIYLVDANASLIVLSRTFKMGLDLFIKDVKVNMNWDEIKTFEALKTVGFDASASVNLTTFFGPLMAEFVTEIKKFIAQARDHYNVNATELILYNYDSYFHLFNQVLEQMVGMKVKSVPLETVVEQSPALTPFLKELPTFISSVGGTIR